MRRKCWFQWLYLGIPWFLLEKKKLRISLFWRRRLIQEIYVVTVRLPNIKLQLWLSSQYFHKTISPIHEYTLKAPADLIWLQKSCLHAFNSSKKLAENLNRELGFMIWHIMCGQIKSTVFVPIVQAACSSFGIWCQYALPSSSRRLSIDIRNQGRTYCPNVVQLSRLFASSRSYTFPGDGRKAEAVTKLFFFFLISISSKTEQAI